MAEMPFSIETHTGEPTHFGERTVVPETWVFKVQFPFWGYRWVRPSAVIVTENGTTTRYPIRDVTREAIWMIYGLVALILLVAWRRRR